MNKNGWTLVGELVALLIAVILLVYVIFGLNRMGLVRDMEEAIPGVKPDLVIRGKQVNYDTVENDLIDASKRYVADKYSNSFDGEALIIRVSQLTKNGYMSTIRDNKNKVCSGYVRVFNDGVNYIYSPYLKCSQYVSEGYEAEYDW